MAEDVEEPAAAHAMECDGAEMQGHRNPEHAEVDTSNLPATSAPASLYTTHVAGAGESAAVGSPRCLHAASPLASQSPIVTVQQQQPPPHRQQQQQQQQGAQLSTTSTSTSTVATPLTAPVAAEYVAGMSSSYAEDIPMESGSEIDEQTSPLQAAHRVSGVLSADEDVLSPRTEQRLESQVGPIRSLTEALALSPARERGSGYWRRVQPRSVSGDELLGAMMERLDEVHRCCERLLQMQTHSNRQLEQLEETVRRISGGAESRVTDAATSGMAVS
ncbi:hypothetical protein GGI07_003282, partial [Coemansia sp. Benny D115]